MYSGTKEQPHLENECESCQAAFFKKMIKKVRSRTKLKKND
jgi:hypothetical protein